MQITYATWNVHRAVGQDERRDPTRIVDAIETALVPEWPDILARQEADAECPPNVSIIDVDRVSRLTGLAHQNDSDDLRCGPQSDGFFCGTILWADPRFERSRADVIDLVGHRHRCAVSVELNDYSTPFHIIFGHFSFSQPLRVVQMWIIGQYIR